MLPELVQAVIAGDQVAVSGLLTSQPELACVRSSTGATRQSALAHFLDPIRRYLYEGDTILHIAAAAYQAEIVRLLLASGAQVNAKTGTAMNPCMPLRSAARIPHGGIRLPRWLRWPA